MKIALIGGHLSPALSILDHLPSDSAVIFIGRQYGFEKDKTETLEYSVITKKSIPFFSLTTGRLQRTISWQALGSLAKIPVGFMQAFQLLSAEKPDVVVGFGGYLSVPVAYAAYVLKIPLVIHEQTFGIGVANKVIAPMAKSICLSWETSKSLLGGRPCLVTGNPLRKEFLQLQKRDEKNNIPPRVLIVGGSSGSHAINVLIEEALEELLSHCHIIHQTGDAKEFNDFDRLQEKKSQLPKPLQERYTPAKFISPEEMASLMNEVDLVISRSGVNTVTELLYLGKPSLLIPLPHGQKNEQRINAQFMLEKGVAEILEQYYTTSSDLARTVRMMLTNLDDYREKGKAAQKYAKKGAAEQIVEVIKHAAKKTTS